MCSNSAIPSGNFCVSQPHVAYILLWYPLFTQPFIFREVQSLKAQGFPLSVYSLYGASLAECSEEMRATAPQTHTLGLKALFSVVGELLRQGLCHPRRTVRILRTCLCRKWPSLEVFGENLWACCAGFYLARCFREAGIDHIHAPWPRGTATAAWVVSQCSGIPFSTAARGDNLNPADPDLVDKLVAACRIRANNRADEERIKALLPPAQQHKTCLVYNSLTLPMLQQAPVPMQSLIRLLAVGRFDITKGFEYLLQACALLKQQGIAFQLTLAGGGGRWLGLGQLEPQLKKLRTELDLEQEVSMPGIVSHELLPQILLESDIFVAPCVIHDSGRRDGIPNTVIEALAYGLPTVTTDINALPEIVRNGETGLTVPQKDPVALAAALRQMIEKPEEARRMGRQGCQLVRTMFDPQSNARALCAFFVNAEKE